MNDEPTLTRPPIDPHSESTVGHPDSAECLTVIGSGYEMGELIARGGMGEVYRGRDLSLDREIAIKVLQDRYPPNSSTAHRFVEEARTTGRLQHPGIPPVHHVGTLPDGRPFLAMKLIRGRTLAQILPDPDGTNLVAAFEAICQAVGYAHANGVIHRDLKPDNIMVGKFGEVQVMDWGLSKTVGCDTNLASVDSTVGPDEDRNATLHGAVLGTPAYMPPEQARGDVAAMEAQSDVFGLGAILCAILTGNPPYLGESGTIIWQLAKNADLSEAFNRLEHCRGEPELIALCKRCLSAKKENRPPNGTAVALEVAALRTAAEARAKTAEIERAATTVRADEESKRHRLRTRLAAGIAIALALGTGVSAWMAVRATSAERATTEQLAETQAQERRAREAEATANAKARELEATLKVVQERTKVALGASISSASMLVLSRAMNDDAISDGERSPIVRLTRDSLAQILALAEREGDSGASIILGHFMLGLLHDVARNTAERDMEYRTVDSILTRLAAEPPKPEQQRELALCYNSIGGWLLARGKTGEAIDSYKKGLVPQRWLAEADPKNEAILVALSASCHTLGNTARQLGRTAEALEYYRQAVEPLKNSGSNEGASALLGTYWNLGGLLRQQWDLDEAVAAYEQAESAGSRIAQPNSTDRAVLEIVHRELAAAKRAQQAVLDRESVKSLPPGQRAEPMLARIRVFSKHKDVANLCSTAELYEALEPRESHHSYNAACCWSLASGLTADAKQREEYAARAIACLRKVPTGAKEQIKSPAKLVDQMKTDSDLTPIRDRAEYRKLVTELESAPPPPVGKK